MKKIYCLICKEKTKYNIRTFVKCHLRKEHDITGKQYYDRYCREHDKEGKCRVCGKKTHFNGILRGYSIFCSNACSLLDDSVYRKKMRALKKRCDREREKYNGKIFLQTKEYVDNVKSIKKKRYGDEKYCNVKQILKTKKERYGDPTYCNVKKIRRTILRKYGGNQYIQQKTVDACKKKYGVDTYFKTMEFRRLMEKRGQWAPLKNISKYEIYKRKVGSETKRWKKILYDKWDGTDYYNGKKLITHQEWKKMYPNINVSNNRLQPSIDHKISVAYGFANKISYKIIGNIKNLCICSRDINVRKNYKIAKEYKKVIKGG